MIVCSDQITNNGGVALNHLIDGLTNAASRIECDLLTNSESRRATGKGQINVHAWFEQGQTYRRLDGIEESMQS